MSVNKYIDIDSSYRDVFTYPSVGDFVMKVNEPTGFVNALTAKVPISDSFPYDTGALTANAAIQTVVIATVSYFFLRLELSLTSRNQTNFYVGSYINLPYANPVGLAPSADLQYWLIVAYTPPTTLVGGIVLCLPYTGVSQFTPATAVNNAFTTPATPYSAQYLTGSYYFIRYALPTFIYTVPSPLIAAGLVPPNFPVLQVCDATLTVLTPTTVNLGPLASAVDNFYTGSFLFIVPPSSPLNPYLKTDPLFAYQFAVITAYVGATKIATLNRALLPNPLVYPVSPAPNNIIASAPNFYTYEICPFTYDDYGSLQYSGTEIFNNPRCANVTLTNLTVPATIPLTNKNGGFITNYPFLWVCLYSEKGITYQQPIISADPSSKKALFKCAITTALSPSVTGLTFLNLSPLMGNQTVNFRINDDLRFQILLPDGEPITFNPSYLAFIGGQFTYFPGLNFPIPQDPWSQVQATFNITFKSG